MNVATVSNIYVYLFLNAVNILKIVLWGILGNTPVSTPEDTQFTAWGTI